MSLDLENINIAYWIAEVEFHKCGYCSNALGSISYGMSVPSLTVQDYQDLIDRGWRRSGTYCYKPIMDQTCCPQYTIKCKALDLTLTKSQKKILKKFNKFLSDGVLSKMEVQDLEEQDHSNNKVMVIKEIPSHLRINDQTKLSLEPSDGLAESHSEVTKPIQINLPLSAEPSQQQSGSYKEGGGLDTSRPPPKKAKLIRIERKKAKLLSKGLEFLPKTTQQPTKTLEDFICGLPSNTKHKLKMELVNVSDRSERWNEIEATVFSLYKKYQTTVHNDKPQECTLQGFTRFLVTSPLKWKSFPKNTEGPGFGSFHQLYWLDEKLIAVGVIDILPKCVSSVYFFYDPDLRNLTLGTYGSLRELEFCRSLHKNMSSIEYYYMGYYIHSCPKMRYKGNLVPSLLLCPETYQWFPLEKCLNKLNNSKYTRFNEDANAKDPFGCTTQQINDINVICGHRFMKYRKYKQLVGESSEVFHRIGQTIGHRSLKNFLFQIID